MLRSKVMMPLFRLPFVYFLFFSLLEFGHMGLVIMTIFLQWISLPSMMNFLLFMNILCVYLCLCNAPYLW